MTELMHVGEGNWEKEVIQAEEPVLVDFTAVWCGPCKVLEPVVNQLAQDWGGRVKIVKLDVDDNIHLAMEYHVMGVPTLILFIGGQPVERVTGYQPKHRLEKKFSAHF